MTGPLAGVKVVEFAAIGPVPPRMPLFLPLSLIFPQPLAAPEGRTTLTFSQSVGSVQ